MSLTKVSYSMITGAPANILDFGADNTGATDCSAAIVAAYTAASEIYFPAGTYRISTNVTIPYSKVIGMAGGSKFTVDSTKTLKIEGQLNAPINEHIFRGVGDVTGVAQVYPEQFGATGDGTTDDTFAFNRAVTCVRESANSVGGKAKIIVGAKVYAFGSTWVIYQSANVPIWVEGAGTLIGGSRLTRTSAFTGTLVSIEGSADPIQRIIDFGFTGLTLIANTLNAGVGLELNMMNLNVIIGLQESLIENVHISGFKFGILISKTRLINFNRVSVWNNDVLATTVGNANWCVQIKDTSGAETPNFFSGDMTWTNCQFVQNPASTFSIGVALEVTQSGNSMAGIRFLNCIFYNARTQFELGTRTGTSLGDIWITACQFDNCPGIGIDIATTGTSNITDIHITDNYFTAVGANCVRMRAANANSVNSIVITDNWSAGVGNAAVDMEKCAAVNISNNIWTGVSWPIGNVVNVTDSNSINIIGNNCGQGGPALAGGFTNLVKLAGTGNYYVVQGNNSAGLATGVIVANTTGAANTSISGNI
jgi:hypothetical protein